jgi:AcrR family transcriptional regulator
VEAPAEMCLRDRKRCETRQRIVDTGRRLFSEKGFEGTTLDAIALEAGISRRTFFSYFTSKEDVLLDTCRSAVGAIRPNLLEDREQTVPIEAARACLLRLVSRFETKESIIDDGLLRSTEALRARKQAILVEMEGALFAALCERWPSASQRDALRLVATAAIGVLRVASEKWREENAKHPLAHYLRKNFELLAKHV